jgi:hypothetical protein
LILPGFAIMGFYHLPGGAHALALLLRWRTEARRQVWECQIPTLPITELKADWGQGTGPF